MTRTAALNLLQGLDRKEPTLQDSLVEARNLTATTGRKHVVRVSCGRYFVVPLFAPGKEGYKHDAGFTSFGQLVEESMGPDVSSEMPVLRNS
jgi:hypothetical protein